MPSTPPDVAPRGAHNPEVKRVRALLRDRAARDDAGQFVAEGPRLLAAALDHGARVHRCLVGAELGAAAGAVVDRARAAGVDIVPLAAGVADRIGDTVTTQAVFTVIDFERVGARALHDTRADASEPALVGLAAAIGDPGNAGTLWRSAGAAGATAFVLGAGSVDAYNPKVVRASAGACFGTPVVEGVPAVDVLEALGARGLQRIGAVAAGGSSPAALDLTCPTVLVLGHEARGLDADLPLDALVTVPMAGGTESLNVAMAGTVLLFEAARQRAEATP